MENFEKLLYQIQQFRSFFVVILGDFNARSKSWWNEDRTSNEGSQIDMLATFIKSKIECQNSIYKTFQNGSKNLAEYDTLQETITEVSDSTYKKKYDYYNTLAKKTVRPYN